MLPGHFALMRRIGLAILLISVPCLAAGDPQAADAEPRTVTLLHEGSLTTPAGLPVEDGEYDLTLHLWSDLERRHLLGREDRSGVRVRAGRFMVELESHLPPGVERSELWLEAEVTPQASGRTVEAASSTLKTAITGWSVATAQYEITESAEGSIFGLSGDLGIANGLGGIDFFTGTSCGFACGAKMALRILPTGQMIKSTGDDAKLAVGHSGFLILGNPSGSNLLLDNNEIMARNGSSASTLYLQHEGGNVHVNGALVHSSDARMKESVEPLEAGLDEVLRLRPVSYEWIGRDDGRRVGLVAQDVREVIEDVVHEGDEGTLGIAYSDLVPLLIRAIQDQQAEIDELRDLVDRRLDPEGRRDGSDSDGKR